ncbi:MAG: protein kinase domain-containing protein, partial [Rubripirellula sp.]
MSVDQQIREALEFVETCTDLGMLADTDAESLRQSVVDQRYMVAQEAVQRGWLTPADVEIVQSLQHPKDVVPGYEILDLIGRGGMGVVYRARQLDLDRVVALKTILINSLSSDTTAARFEREAKALARLQHPNIVQALNFGQQDGRYYFAMEYVSGSTCEQLVAQHGRLQPSQV